MQKFKKSELRMNPKMPIENRIDRMINDIGILKQEIAFGNLDGSIKFPSNFKIEEIPVINYWKVYLEDLREKIVSKKNASKFVNKIINY